MSEKIKVARTSAIVGGILALLKVGIGCLSGSLALLSEGIHSSLDFAVTLAVWLSVKSSDVPADREHHYGHGKIENLTAFAQALLLIVTAILIITHAVEHLHDGMRFDLGIGWYAAVAVISVSILVDLSRARLLAKAAKKFNSQALEADATHFATELLASAAVLAGLLLAKFGGEKFWMADPIAAIVVAVIMTITALRLGRRAADVLIDRAPEGLVQEIETLVRNVAGVRDVVRVRVREAGARTFVDATIAVDPSIALSAGHDIADNVELRVTEKHPNIDMVVHVEPAAAEDDPTEIVHRVARELNIHVHAIRIRDLNGLHIHFHAEFPPGMTLADAHHRVTELEERVRLRLPAVAEIISHVEPERERA